jgi:hypothetical protein
MTPPLSSLYFSSPLFSMLSSSRLISNIKALSELSGEFYFYEPRERLLSSGFGSPLVWESVSPIERESLYMGELDCHSSALRASLGSGMTKLSPEEAIMLICEKRLWHSVSLLWISDHCLSGDYCGAPHTLSNKQVLLDEFGGSPMLRDCYGSYGSSSVVVDPRYLSDELLETLQSLERYPVMDEDHCSSLELDLQTEAWENWAEREFSSALEERLSSLCGDELAEQAVESLSSERLWAVFESLREEANEYWQSQSSPNQWIDVERIVERASSELLLSILSQSLSQALHNALAPLLLSEELLASS